MIARRAGYKLVWLALLGVFLAAHGTANASDDEWEYSVSPLFLWGLSLEGDATINGTTAPLDLNFRDNILENLEAVFTIHFEARRGDWSLFTEYQYVDLNPTGSVVLGPVSINADITFKEDMFELGAGWAFSDTGRTRWELIGGARYTDQSLTALIDIETPVPPIQPGAELLGGDDWWQGFVGLRVKHSLGEKWTFVARGDLGYGGSDNSATNFAFQFDYRFRDWGSAFFGVRYLSYDYSSSSYGFDATKAGPLAGLTIHW